MSDAFGTGNKRMEDLEKEFDYQQSRRLMTPEPVHNYRINNPEEDDYQR